MTAAPPIAADRRSLAIAFVWPSIFVFLWSSGYISAKFALDYAEPFTILDMRFATVSLAMALYGWAVGAQWPRRPVDWGHVALVGVLLHGGYLGGIYAALQLGIPAGITALVMGLQPVLTATVVGPWLGEQVRPRQWLGLVLGLVGVALVLANKIHFDFDGRIGLFACLFALLSITAATLYQKRFCGAIDLRTGQAIQYGAAAIVCLPIMLWVGPGQIDWTLDFILAMIWIVFILSAGAYTLYMWLIGKNAATKLASYLYLVPPVTAIAAWAMFGETMGPLALIGMGLAVLGVALVVRS